MHYLNKFSQTLIWFIARLYLLITFSKRKMLIQPESIKDEFGYVIAANHRTGLDPVVFLGALPFRLFIKLYPVRCMANRKYFGPAFLNVIFGKILLSLGAFPAKEIANLDFGLPLSTRILADKGTIAIFPEGKWIRNRREAIARRGVAVLASEPDVEVILCHFIWHGRWSPRVSIVISEPGDYSDKSAQQILDEIYSL
jgi:1-acyl-sn-glycerol-3-phosphate acyltransferase